MPLPVLGGAGVVLFGSVAASGIHTLVKAGMEKDNNVVIVAVSLAVGIIPITSEGFYHAFPENARIVLDSGISTGCLAAILLNLLFHHPGGSRDEETVAHPMETGADAAGASAAPPARAAERDGTAATKTSPPTD